MRLHLLSDLHLDSSPYRPDETYPFIIDADAVILAGDIARGVAGVLWAQKAFADKRVIYVLGNHEYYGGQREATLQTLRCAAKGSNVTVLDRDEAVIDGVRFLGTTLWTDFELQGKDKLDGALQHCQTGMADFFQIQDANGDLFTALQAKEEHDKSVQWLNTKLDEPFQGETVVVTHHGCSKYSIAPQWLGKLLCCAFSSNLDHLMGRCALWVHGHVHNSFDYTIAGTRVRGNPRGYCRTGNGSESENNKFDNNFVIEI